MIFICVGSREYQFDRLIKEIDELIGENKIQEEVFGQIGQSNYIPKNFEYVKFLSTEEFSVFQKKADIIISHGGTGALISSIKLGKKVIAVPRLSKYGEHTDDHQLQVSSVLNEQGYLKSVTDIRELFNAIDNARNESEIKKYNRKSNVLEIINEFIRMNY